MCDCNFLHKLMGTDPSCCLDKITAPGYVSIGSCVGVGGIGKGGTGAVIPVMEGLIEVPIAELSILTGLIFKFCVEFLELSFKS